MLDNPEPSRKGSAVAEDRSVAHALLRISLGTTMLLHGVVRLMAGAGRFADGMVRQFASTPMPGDLVRAFGTALPFIETLLGVLLLLGFGLRWTLVAGALLMTILIFGSTLRGDFQVVGLQLIYALAYFVLLFTREYDRYSVDGFRRR
jgi:thiosulfate dehydrogenase [quinone] large subunit